MSTATAKPQPMPAMAPKAFMRFHQIDSTSTGKNVEPLSASDQSSRRNGSFGAISAMTPPSTAAPAMARRAHCTRPVRGSGSHDRPLTMSSATTLPRALAAAPAPTSAAATMPAAAK